MKFIINLEEDFKSGGFADTKTLPFSGTNPKTGEVLGVNRRCFTKNGTPWFPIMGEFHFSRYEKSFWEEELLKMKAGGVQIIAAYIFWIHHEEEEGVFDWTGNKDLRTFISLCNKCGLYLFLRVGPWAHGECRNGGFPDWLLQKGFELRSDNDGYLACVKKLFSEIYKQSDGLLFKNGGPVIGLQIENEYGHCGGFRGEKGKRHMMTLKQMAVETGFTVPYYTATGWGGAVVVEDEMLPVMGAYADAPWDKSLKRLPLNQNFIFSHLRNDEGIGSDFNNNSMYAKNYTFNPDDHPYATAELGGGIQITKHRRPVVSAKDTEVMIFSRLGSGANLIGYYMYHGGTNFIGKLSTMQESKPRGHCDLPILSYDFQGVIGEYGDLHESFRYLKILHMLLADFGSEMAAASSFIPKDSAKNAEDLKSLRYSVRHKDGLGFLFLNNYQRHATLDDKNGLKFEINGGCNVKFPTIDLKSGENIILPFNLNINGVNIEYATAQPLCRLDNVDETTVVFWTYNGVCEYKIDGAVITAEPNSIRTVESTGKKIAILTLNRRDAENAWKIEKDGKQLLVITNAAVIEKNDGTGYTFLTKDDKIDAKSFPSGVTINLTLSDNIAPLTAKFERIKPDDDDLWFRINLPKLFVNDNAVEHDVFLTVDFSGNIANLFLNGKLSADWFYTGLDWRIGLKKFKDIINDSEITLQIKPLSENAEVYLENPPVYKNGVACELNGLSLTVERCFDI